MCSALDPIEYFLINGCRAFRRAMMLTLNVDFFNFKIFVILVLIIFTTSAIIKNAIFYISFQTWIWPFAIRVMFDKGCWWVSSKKAVGGQRVFKKELERGRTR